MRAFQHLAAGAWEEALQTDRVRLDFDQRHRRRLMLRTEGGCDLLLDLPHAVHLREGDGLRTEQGGIVRVCARPEALLEIRAAPPVLVRIAWHLGNRHLPVQLLDGAIRLRADHVIAAMAEGLGGVVREVEAPFDPEPGAYGGHAHDHG